VIELVNSNLISNFGERPLAHIRVKVYCAGHSLNIHGLMCWWSPGWWLLIILIVKFFVCFIQKLFFHHYFNVIFYICINRHGRLIKEKWLEIWWRAFSLLFFRWQLGLSFIHHSC